MSRRYNSSQLFVNENAGKRFREKRVSLGFRGRKSLAITIPCGAGTIGKLENGKVLTKETAEKLFSSIKMDFPKNMIESNNGGTTAKRKKKVAAKRKKAKIVNAFDSKRSQTREIENTGDLLQARLKAAIDLARPFAKDEASAVAIANIVINARLKI